MEGTGSLNFILLRIVHSILILLNSSKLLGEETSMNRVKYTSTSTGTSTLELSIPSGFQDLSQAVNTYGSSDIFYLYPIDGNGTDWEVGYGTMYGSTFTRVAVFESTNSDSFIDCSANEHTILCHRSFYEGHVITAAYEPESGGGFLYLRPALHLLPGPTSWAM